MKLIVRSIFLIIFVALLSVVALALLPGGRIAEVAERQFEAATGRSLEIRGKISPTLFPVLGVRIGDVSVANADWAGTDPMFEAEGVSLGVHLRPLLSGRVEIDEIRLEAPLVRMAVSEDGRANWEVSPTSNSSQQTERELPPISISAVKVQGATIAFDDREAGINYGLEDTDFELKLSDDGVSLWLAGALSGAPIRARGEIEDPAALLGGDVSSFTFNGEIAKSAVALDGSLDLSPLSVRSSVLFEGGDPDQLLRRFAGVSLDLPSALLNDPKFSGTVTYAEDGVVYLRNGYLRAGPNEVALDADLRSGKPRPRLSARMSSGRLDLSELASGPAKPANKNSAPGWPRKRIDVSSLGLLDAEIRLDVAGLSLGQFDVGRLAATINIDRSRMVSKIHELNVYGGRVDGTAVVNGRNGLSLGGDLRATGLALRPLLIDLAEQDRLSAPADLKIKYLAVGNTVHDLMQSLSGDGRFKVGSGELRGIDLPQLRTALGFGERTPGARTVFEGVGGSFTVDAGVLRNSDMSFASPIVDGTGAGTVDIGRRFVDYRLVPVVSKRAGEITVPLDIAGPWSDITIRPNVASLVGQNLDAPLNLVRNGTKAALRIKQDEGKAEAYEKISGELDTPVETTADVEDALEGKAVRELERGLKRLFD
jgi:AsmA protein